MNRMAYVVTELCENALIVGSDQRARRVARVARARRWRAAERRDQMLLYYASLNAYTVHYYKITYSHP